MLVHLLAFLSLVFIYIQDLRHRMIYWPLLVLIFILPVVTRFSSLQEINMLLWYILVNSILVGWQVAGVYLYLRIRYGRVHLTGAYLGWGDILFMIAVTSWFTPAYFLVFIVGGLFFSLAAALLMYATGRWKKEKDSVPLAGLLAVFLLLLKVYALIAERVWFTF